ncbi:MAG: 16S rRNA processing protein RimM [Epsilonproteobacteria bacterium]|nr:16S rRNA processing protein RimM [Campylobacterota bacterium]
MNKIPIIKIGKAHGVRGWNKFHLLTDFPQQLKEGRTFKSDKISLTIQNIDRKNNLIKFQGYDTPEMAKKLTNRHLYTTQEESRKNIKLKPDEWFWFDIIGSKVIENDQTLGEVIDINRINDIDYVVVQINPQLGYKQKRYLFDFKRHIVDVDTDNQVIIVKDTLPILEAS